MTSNTISASRANQIKAEAVAATLLHSHINEACPYPFGSPESQIFVPAFNAERNRQEEEILNDTKARANRATAVFNVQLQHPNSIASDTIDTIDTNHRPGSLDAFSKPSRQGDSLHYRDGSTVQDPIQHQPKTVYLAE